MRTLFIINLAFLYVSVGLLFNNLVVRTPLFPFSHASDPMSVQFSMYVEIVPFSVFAILTTIALWQGVGWSRGLVATIRIPPIAIGSLVYVIWWIGPF